MGSAYVLIHDHIGGDRVKKDNELEKMLGKLKHGFRIRKGLFGKKDISIFGKVINLDNEIPGIILDTFDNLGFVTKDDRRPVIVSKNRTGYGWYMVFNLPPGISFKKCKLCENIFSDAVKGFVSMSWNGCLHMDIQTNSLPTSIPYSWDAEPYANMELPIPIGYTQKGLEVFDLTNAPHMLIAGQTGFGKTVALHCIANALIPRARVCIVDPKKLDFRYLKNHVCLARDDEAAMNLFKLLNREYDRRINILESCSDDIVKVQEYEGNDMPYIVVIIDELAELSKDTHIYINRLLRLARAVGISIIGASQRISVKIIEGDTRELFEARLAFKVANETSSRMILGEENSMAAWLPVIKGRAIFKFGHELKEVQTMFLDKKDRKRLVKLYEPRGWEFDTSRKLQP